MEIYDRDQRRSVKEQLQSNAWKLYNNLREGTLPSQDDITNVLIAISQLRFEMGVALIMTYLTCSRREEILKYEYVSDKYEPLFREVGYPLPIVKDGIKRKNIKTYEDNEGNRWVQIVTRKLKQSSHDSKYPLDSRYRDLTSVQTKSIDLLYDTQDPDYKLLKVVEEYIDTFDSLANVSEQELRELPLFPNVRYNQITDMLDKYKLNMHALRRLRATHLRERGYDVSDLMATGGWKSLVMPGIYAPSSKESRMSKLLKNVQMKPE